MQKKGVYSIVLVIFIILFAWLWFVLSNRHKQELNIEMCRNLIEVGLFKDDKLCRADSIHDTFQQLFRVGEVDIRFVKVAMSDYVLYEESHRECISGDPGTVLNYGIGKEAPWGGYSSTVEFIFCNNQLVQYLWYD